MTVQDPGILLGRSLPKVPTRLTRHIPEVDTAPSPVVEDLSGDSNPWQAKSQNGAGPFEPGQSFRTYRKHARRQPSRPHNKNK